MRTRGAQTWTRAEGGERVAQTLEQQPHQRSGPQWRRGRLSRDQRPQHQPLDDPDKCRGDVLGIERGSQLTARLARPDQLRDEATLLVGQPGECRLEGPAAGLCAGEQQSTEAGGSLQLTQQRLGEGHDGLLRRARGRQDGPDGLLELAPRVLHGRHQDGLAAVEVAEQGRLADADLGGDLPRAQRGERRVGQQRERGLHDLELPLGSGESDHLPRGSFVLVIDR